MTTIFNYETDNGRVKKLGDQLGWGHMRPIYVDDVNRICNKFIYHTRGKIYYYYSSRADSVKTVEMFKVWQWYYNPKCNKEFGARAHNAGKNWDGRDADIYWSRIKKRLNKKLK